MGNRTSGYGPLGDPDYSAQLICHVQQEKPDGSLWSAAIFLDDLEQTGSRRFFQTLAEAESWAEDQLR